jgi:hypothetical protein
MGGNRSSVTYRTCTHIHILTINTQYLPTTYLLDTQIHSTDTCTLAYLGATGLLRQVSSKSSKLLTIVYQPHYLLPCINPLNCNTSSFPTLTYLIQNPA